MRRTLFLVCLSMWLFSVRGQDPNDVQPPALALHFVFNDFASVKTPAGGSFHETKAGLAASYLRGLNRRVDLSITLAGSIVRFPFRKGLTEDGKELLLLEADVSLRYKLLPGYHLLSPYLRGGLGLSDYQGKLGMLLPVGVGMQVNLTSYTFLLLEAQYRPS